MKNKYKFEITLTITLILLGQIFFALMSTRYTTPHYENRIYSTTGVMHDSSDLHRLNEAAHYFGQTIIGWTKFPHFMGDLIKFADLPEGTSINAHMQERQNMVFTVTTPKPIEMEKLIKSKDFLQKKMDTYNETNRTKFVLSSLDFEQYEVKKSYGFGAGIALIISIVISAGLIFIKREYKNCFPNRSLAIWIVFPESRKLWIILMKVWKNYPAN